MKAQGAEVSSVGGIPTIWVPATPGNGGRLDGVKNGTAVTIWTDRGVPNNESTANSVMAAVLRKV
jgi:hypothetical protein